MQAYRTLTIGTLLLGFALLNADCLALCESGYSVPGACATEEKEEQLNPIADFFSAAAATGSSGIADIHVSALTGDDANSGSAAAPVATLYRAVNLLATGRVHLAAGEYAETEQITIRPGIEIYGGYTESDWVNQDSTANTTTVTYAGSNATSSVGSFIWFTGGYTADGQVDPNSTAAVLDGVTIDGGAIGESLIVPAVLVSTGNATISNCTINANTARTAVQYGGYGSFKISNTTINPKMGEIAGDIFGVSGFAANTDATSASTHAFTMENSTINEGQAIYSGSTYGFYANYVSVASGESATITLTNNTIQGGRSKNDSHAVALLPVNTNVTMTGNEFRSGRSSVGDFAGLFIGNSGSTVNASSRVLFTAGIIDGSVSEWWSGSRAAYGVTSQTSLDPNTVVTIQNSLITAGSGPTSGDAVSPGSVGIYARGGSWTITGNTIDGEGAPTAAASAGIIACSSSRVITNNLVYGGLGKSSAALSIRDECDSSGASNSLVYNNTLIAGLSNTNAESAAAAAFYGTGAITADLRNNVFFVYAAVWTTRFCLHERSAGKAAGATIANNLFYACGTAMYDADAGCSGSTNCANVAQMEALSAGYSGNLDSVVPRWASLSGPDGDIATIADNDYSLTAGSPTSITQGGADVSGTVSTDRTGATRTLPFSIGAYEY